MMGAADVLIADVRDPPEVQANGKIKGAVAVSRGMLKFRADLLYAPIGHPKGFLMDVKE